MRVEYTSPVITTPKWAGDFYGGHDGLMPYPAKIDPYAFTDDGGIAVVTSGAALGATTVPVTALAGRIPQGAVLDFGTTKFAAVTAEALKGATSIATRALVTALVNGDRATYSPSGRRMIRSGRIVGRTFAERDANTPFGPAIDTDDEIFLLAYDVEVDEYGLTKGVALYRPGLAVKENYLPDYASIAANLLTKLRTIYRCYKGTD